MKKRTIAVIFGGKSAEHDVSIITAHIPIIPSLRALGTFDVIPVYIAKDGSWYSDVAMNDMAFFTRPDYEEHLKKQKKLQFDFASGFNLVQPGLIARRTQIDIVFPSMHGTYGEDGSLMGLLRMANVPFVGCDLFASAAAMDKVLTKQILASEGIPIVPYVWCTKHDWTTRKDTLVEKIERLSWPLFVKPVHLGSSIAITKAKDMAQLENAIEVAFHYDDKILIEESVESLIEVTLPIMGNNELRLGAIERPLNQTEFFDFNDKYLSGGKKGAGVNSQYSEIPAEIDSELAGRVEAYGKATYRALGCSGTARVDFLIDSASNKVYVNEVNTLPGSLYHHNWQKSGVSNVELISELVRLAEEHFAETKDLTRTFQSSILSNGSGAKLDA